MTAPTTPPPEPVVGPDQFEAARAAQQQRASRDAKRAIIERARAKAAADALAKRKAAAQKAAAARHAVALARAQAAARKAALARQRAAQTAAAAKAARTHSSESVGGSIPAVWVALVQCEASGDWQYGGPHGHTDAGYTQFEGGPNFLHSTWLAYGGGQYAQHAWGATPWQQLVVARRTLASEGVNAWPVCGPRVGLRQGD